MEKLKSFILKDNFTMDKLVTLKEMDKATYIFKIEINMLDSFLKAKSWDLDSFIKMEYAPIKDFG